MENQEELNKTVDIADRDSNFKAPNMQGGLVYREIQSTDARTYGLYPGKYYRAPMELCEAIGERITALNHNLSGGRVRFQTNSKRIGIRATLWEPIFLPHMPLSGSSSLDIFVKKDGVSIYKTTIRPEGNGLEIGGELILQDPISEVTIYLPLYNGLTKLEIGTEPETSITVPSEYTYNIPVVFYGSSITQGGCASRGANSYPAMVCRELDSDFINFGYSGQAKGDLAFADYIASLPISCFVYDYDHNAESDQFLKETHLPFLQRILERQPNLPVIVLSRPDPDFSDMDYKRRQVILQTCDYFVSKRYNVQFLDGWQIFNQVGHSLCTVDGCHPNDLGFYCMAKAVKPVLEHMLNHSGAIAR